MKKIFAGLIAMMILLVGCSSGGSGLKEIKTRDLCVTHINLDSKICYGDARNDVEVIAGSAESESSNRVSYLYSLNVTYRDDKVVLIALSEGSQDMYQPSFDVRLGETRKELKDKYGDKYNEEMPDTELNYLFDVENRKLITNDSLVDLKSVEESDNYLTLSVSFDDKGMAKRIYLSDWPALKYGM